MPVMVDTNERKKEKEKSSRNNILIIVEEVQDVNLNVKNNMHIGDSMIKGVKGWEANKWNLERSSMSTMKRNGIRPWWNCNNEWALNWHREM